MQRVRITLPIPDRVLSPNARVHWATKSRAVKAARQLAYIETRNAIASCKSFDPWDDALCVSRFYFATERTRDKDNAQASLKAAFDGIADAGIVTNDSAFTHRIEIGESDKANPRVEITISQWRQHED